MTCKINVKGLQASKISELEEVVKYDRRVININLPKEVKAGRWSISTAKKLLSFGATNNCSLSIGQTVLDCERGAGIVENYTYLKNLLYTAEMEAGDVQLEARFVMKVAN